MLNEEFEKAKNKTSQQSNNLEFRIWNLEFRIRKLILSHLRQSYKAKTCPTIFCGILLNWEPKINLDERLVKTIEYFKNIVK